jgi:beta-lactamase superfamily II metal-dependent hydrolase
MFLQLPSCDTTESNAMKIHFLNVGKADCIVIQVLDHTILIDTAEKENRADVISFLQSKNVRKIDTLILSHFDKDHIGGAEDVINTFSVSRVIESTFTSDREEYFAYHEAVEKKDIKLTKINSDYHFSVGDCHFSVLAPQKSFYPKKEDNNASLIVSMEYMGKKFLFCGDAMEDRLKEFTETNQSDYDLVKIPYHGNYIDNLEEFLCSVNCSNAVICDSDKNPADEKTIDLLKKYNISYYSTKNGNISVSLDSDHVIQISQ